MTDLTREQAIEWCVDKGADFIKPEVLEQWRQEFEIWHMQKYGYLGCYEMSGFVYQRHDVECRWCTWKEARQTVRIPLPERTAPFQSEYNSGIDACETAIESAGYKCEGVGGDELRVNQQPAGQE